MRKREKSIVAYGDRYSGGKLKVIYPIIGTYLTKKFSISANVVFINEFNTCKLCIGYHHEMVLYKGYFMVKRCVNNKRTVRDRDVNTDINILNLFLLEMLFFGRDKKHYQDETMSLTKKLI